MKRTSLNEEQKSTIKYLYCSSLYSIRMVAHQLHLPWHIVRDCLEREHLTRNPLLARQVALKLNRVHCPKREKHHNWKGGKSIYSGGYIAILVSPNDPFYEMGRKEPGLQGSYVLEHRLIMARYLGRALTKQEIVHHLNGIRSDNRFKNLALVTRGNHPHNTLVKLLQKRIRDLEAKLAQQKF